MIHEAERLRREARAMALLRLARKFDTRVEATSATAQAWAMALGARDYDALEAAVIEYYSTSTYPLMVAHLTRKVREPDSHPFDPNNLTHERLAREWNAAYDRDLPLPEAYHQAIMADRIRRVAPSLTASAGAAAVAAASMTKAQARAAEGWDK